MGLIDKQIALQVFDNIPTINGLGLEPVIALRDVKEIIKAVPEVDAAPVVHGRWEEPEPEGVMSWDKHAYCQCSVCKKKSYLGRTDNHCRYCAAKMDLEG